MKLAIFSSLLALAFAQWTKPLLVMPNTTNFNVPFTDNFDAVHHVVLCREPQLVYVRVYPNGTVTPEVVLNPGMSCNYRMILTGLHDGKTLYLTYVSPRDTKGAGPVFDIYFTESIDGGANWSRPTAVPRRNMSDELARTTQDFLIAQGNRLWIFYSLYVSEVPTIAFVTRAPGSSMFSLEEVLPFSTESRIEAIYNKGDTSSKISLYYITADILYSYYTTNNGINWKGPDEVNYCESNKTVGRPFNTYETSSSLFIICSDMLEYLRKSDDQGKTWTTISIGYMMTSDRFIISGDGKGDGMMSRGILSMYFMRFTDTKFRKLEPPFNPPSVANGRVTNSHNHNKIWAWFQDRRAGKGTLDMYVISLYIYDPIVTTNADSESDLVLS